MPNPYHPAVADNLDTGTVDTTAPGTAYFFNPALGSIKKGNGTYKTGAIGISPTSVDDPDLARAINALAYNDSERWPRQPEDAGSAVPLAVRLVDSPEANLIANFMGRSLMGFVGTPVIPAGYTGLIGVDTASARYVVSPPPSGGTVPYVNPAGAGNPDAIAGLNYLLDKSNYKL